MLQKPSTLVWLFLAGLLASPIYAGYRFEIPIKLKIKTTTLHPSYSDIQTYDGIVKYELLPTKPNLVSIKADAYSQSYFFCDHYAIRLYQDLAEFNSYNETNYDQKFDIESDTDKKRDNLLQFALPWQSGSIEFKTFNIVKLKNIPEIFKMVGGSVSLGTQVEVSLNLKDPNDLYFWMVPWPVLKSGKS